MKKALLQLLQFILALAGLVFFYLMIRLPQTEGRAKDLNTFQIYSDPFILYGYISSIPFFIALYNGIRLLKLIAQNKWHSSAATKTLKRIRYCALLSNILIAGAAAYILVTHDKEDDPVGFLAICMTTIVIGFAAVVITLKYERMIESSLKNKRSQTDELTQSHNV